MAITTASHSGRNSFTVNATTADLSGCETLLAAVADKRIVIDSIAINAGASITVTVGEGETTGAITTALLGPVSLIEGLTWSKEFPDGLYLTAATALTADASGAGAVCITATCRVVD
jgi:hypothetical protein